MPSPRTCSHCLHRNPQQAAFCAMCGRPILSADERRWEKSVAGAVELFLVLAFLTLAAVPDFAFHDQRRRCTGPTRTAHAGLIFDLPADYPLSSFAPSR